MKQHYNFKINPDKLSAEEIEQHKDFDALLGQYEQTAPEAKPPAKRFALRYMAGAAAAMLLGALFYFSFMQPTSDTLSQEQAYFDAQPFINPPLKNVQAKFASHAVNANEGGVYNYKTGSQVIFPAAAFIDKNGNLVEGEVDIKYREFHDFVDFFLSGIPMTYDSLNVQYHLESAGMVEIYAEQNGERLEINPDKAIEVVLISEIEVPNVNVKPSYNIYKLDTEQRNWVYKGVDNIEVQAMTVGNTLQSGTTHSRAYKDALKQIEANYQQKLKELESSVALPAKPVLPQRPNGDDLVFDFGFDEQNFGGEDEGSTVTQIDEAHKNMLWQLSPRNTNLDENALRVEWEDVQVKKLNNKEYELTLISGDKRLKVFANPVLSGEAYEKAMSKYDAEMTVYNSELEKREGLLAPNKARYAEKMRVEKVQAKSKYDPTQHNSSSHGHSHSSGHSNKPQRVKIINRFVANSFGIWNCDRPLPPSTNKVEGEFMDEKNNHLNQHVAFLVDKNKNTLVRFLANKGKEVTFNNNSDNMMWVVTKDEKIAVYRPENFKRINQKKGSHTFVMDVEEAAIKDEEDVRRILNFQDETPLESH